jgi:diamine N-acetyltransferase
LNQKGNSASGSRNLRLTHALFAPEAWYRAICLGEAPVGFLVLKYKSLRSPSPDNPKVGVSRLMVGAKFRGLGKTIRSEDRAHSLLKPQQTM